MSPTRRTVLRTVGLAASGTVAGCLTSAAPPTDDRDGTTTPGSPDDAPADGTRPSNAGGPSITITGSDPPPALPVVPTVAVTETTATAAHPPQVRVTVTNDGDEPIRLGEARAVVFEYVTDDTADLIFLPPGGDYPARADCWRLTEPIAVTAEFRTVELEPGDAISRLVDLYGTARGDGCLPVGEYRFQSTYTVLRDRDGGTPEDERASWGFSIRLE